VFAVKNFGASKETTQILNEIINIRQSIFNLKILIPAYTKIEGRGKELIATISRIESIKEAETAKQIARARVIKEELRNLRKDMLKLSKEQRNKEALKKLGELMGMCDAIIAKLT
jgi:hypothetical protein